jgi:hypothetical protein
MTKLLQGTQIFDDQLMFPEYVFVKIKRPVDNRESLPGTLLVCVYIYVSKEHAIVGEVATDEPEGIMENMIFQVNQY